MKKSTIIVVMALLCLNFWAFGQTDKAIDVTAKGIQVGQAMPEIYLDSVLHSTSKGIALSSFKGKLLIIDFWATWCGPCVGMLPKMEQLQQQFQGKLQFLSASYQTNKEVKSFLEQRYPKQLPHLLFANSEKQLHRLFPHVYLPHYVWIDQNGIVRAITDHEAVDAGHIEQMLKGQFQNFETKHDTKLVLDQQKLLLDQKASVFQNSLIGYSYFSGYIEGLNAGYTIYPTDAQKGKRFTATNLTLMNLFSIAYRDYGNFGYKNMVFDIKDSSQLSLSVPKTELKNWVKQHSYCFEMVTAPEQSDVQLFYAHMRKLLSLYFPKYQANIAYKQQPCLALVRTSTAVKFAKSTDSTSFLKVDAQHLHIQNQHFMQLLRPLATYYLQQVELPIIDETNYTGPINLSLNANLSDINAINTALKAYDLALVEKIGACPVVLIKEL